jgi:hypothetical protein
MSTELDQELESYDIAKLRKYAALNRISITREMDKAAIIEAIKNKNRGKDFILLAEAGKAPKPGFARIILQRDPTPGAANRPVYVQVNGYKCTVPRGVEVDVPHKVVNVLNDAKERKVEEDPSEPVNSMRRFKYVEIHSYPFSVLMATPGPDPSPSPAIQAKQAGYGPRLEYRDKYGRWPRRSELLEAIKNGFIKHRPPGYVDPEDDEVKE